MTSRQKAMEIAAKARKALESIYGERLRGSYLLGPWPRGEVEGESDVLIRMQKRRKRE